MIVNKFINLLCISILAIGASSYAMDPSSSSPRATSGQAGQVSSSVSSKKLKRQLIDAAKSGNITQVEVLLNQGAPVDTKAKGCRTPLYYAATNNHLFTCKLLIEKKATIDAKNVYGATPLMNAAAHNQERACKLLIQHNASINATENNGKTILTVASLYRSERTCRVLIDAKIKQTQAVAIVLLGIKKFRNPYILKLIGREIMQLIARQAHVLLEQQLIKELNSNDCYAQQQKLIHYAKQQLLLRK